MKLILTVIITILEINFALSQLTFIENYRKNPSCNYCNGELIVSIYGLYTPYYAYITEIGSQRTAYGPFYGNTLTIKDLCARSYLLEIVDACGCYGKYSFNLLSGSLNVNVTQTPANCSNQFGSLLVNLPNSSSYKIYYRKSDQQSETLISANGPAISISPLVPGLYFLRIKDNNSGCEQTVTKEVTSNKFSVETTILNASCNASNGSVLFNLNGASLPVSFDYFGIKSGSGNSSQNSFSVFNLPSGIYTFVIKDRTGCTNSITIIIETIDNIKPVVRQPTPSDCNGENGSINLLLSGANTPYTIEYSGQGLNDKFQSNSTTPSIPKLKFGSYKIKITNSLGCFVEINAEVPNGAPWIQIESIMRDNCIGNGAFTSTVYNYNSISIYGPDGKLVKFTGPCNKCTQPYNLSNLKGGFYKIVIETSGCSKTYEVEIPSDGPVVNIKNQVPIDCANQNGGYIELDVKGGKSPYDVLYRHDTEAGHKKIPGTPSNPPFYIPTTKEGFYFICITDQNGCSTLIKVEAKTTGGPQIKSCIIKPATCYQNNGSLILEWYATKAPYIINIDGQTIPPKFTTDLTLLNLLPGKHKVILFDALNCSTEKEITIDDESGIINDPTKLTLLNGSNQTIIIYNDLSSKQYYVWGMTFCRNNVRIDSILGTGMSNIFNYGNGNSSTFIDYLNNNKIFIWCKAYDNEQLRGCPVLRYLNGPLKLTCINSVNNTESSIKVDIFPNPTRNHLNILVHDRKNQKLQFKLYNSVGHELDIEEIATIDNNKFILNLNSLDPGIYFLSVWQNNEKVTKTFIVY